MTQITVNGNTYSDDGSTLKDMNNGGFRQNLLPMVSDTLIDTAGKVVAAAHQVELAEAAAAAAATAASTAVSGPGSTGSSTTSLTIALGVQALVIQAGKTLAPGMPCTIASTASPRNWMNGSIDSYNPATGALQVYVTNIGVVTPGVYPTLTAWSISLSGPAASSGVQNELKSASISSASTVNLDSATGNYLHLTGNAGPISTVTLAQGAEREVTFDGTPTLVHSASLDLPTKANIQAQVGDVARFRGEGGGVVKVTNWTRASGRPLIAPGSVEMTLSGTFNPVPGASYYFVDLIAGGASGNAALNSWAAGGGGGERIQRLIPASAVTAAVSVLVGSAGLPVTTVGTDVLGNDGSNTSFGSTVVAHGGKASRSIFQGGDGGGILATANQLASGQLGAAGSYFTNSGEWGGGAGGGINQNGGRQPSPGGSSLYGGAGGGSVAQVSDAPAAAAGGKSGATYTPGLGGLAGTSASRNGGKGSDATSVATSGDGGGASYYTGANNVGGDGGFPGGGGGGAVSSSGTATSGAGKPGIARIYWW